MTPHVDQPKSGVLYHGEARRAEDESFWWRLARTKTKYSPLLSLIVAIGLILGFQWLSPNERITALEQRAMRTEADVADVRSTLRVIRDAKCVELTPAEASVIQLDCSEIYERMQRAEVIQRGRTPR